MTAVCATKAFSQQTSPATKAPSQQTSPMAAGTEKQATPITPDAPMVRSKTTQDRELSAAVKSRIAQDKSINSQGINVEADRGTVYLTGPIDNADQKARAERRAMEVAGVSSVVNRLGDQRVSRAETTPKGCKLIVANAPARTEGSFIPFQLRVYEDVGSPLYAGQRTVRYDERTGKVHDKRMGKVYDERTGKVYDERTGEIYNERTGRVEETRVTSEEKAAAVEATPPIGETSAVTTERTMTSQQTEKARLGEASEKIAAEDRLAHYDERARLYRDEARLGDRRGNLIWSGWVRQGESHQITSTSGPIRYEYRYAADDRFHGDQGAWCTEGRSVIVP
jgi:hypothetical protein